MPGFTLQTWNNVVRGSALNAQWWGPFAEGLKWETNAFGGYGTCTFTLRANYNILHAMILGQGGGAMVGDRLRIIDPFGVPVYEGMIYTLNLRTGGETETRDMTGLYNIAKVNYNVPYRTGPKSVPVWHADASSYATWGKKPMYLQLAGSYPANTTTPQKVANRFVGQNSQPARTTSRKKGGTDRTLGMEVGCVGLVTPGLEWRSAFSNLATLVDSARIVKDMLSPSTTSEGHAGAHRGPAGSGWVEQLDVDGFFGYGQQFIENSNFSHISNSGSLIERNSGSGSSRIDIVKNAASVGSSNAKRELFQVWEDPDATKGKGVAYFNEMSEVGAWLPNYTGYYDVPNSPSIWYTGNWTRIPMWRVHAGQWITTAGLSTTTVFPSIYKDPRAFWIESTMFEADTMTLTLSSSSLFDIKRYVGRLIGGKKIIQGTV